MSGDYVGVCALFVVAHSGPVGQWDFVSATGHFCGSGG